MAESEAKTGESIDVIKEEVIIPSVTSIILDHKDPERDELVVYDLGTGDFSTFKGVITEIEKNNIFVKSIALLDLTDRNFLEICKNLGPWLNSTRNTALIENIDRKQEGVVKFLGEPCLDIAHSTNVFHQIKNDSELLLSMINISRGLRDDGIFVLTDLHPEYINWLYEHYPEKLDNAALENENIIFADYKFDSKGSKPLYNRDILKITELALLSGLEPIRLEELYLPEKFAESKIRYKDMVEGKVPMFYTIAFRKAQGDIDIVEGGIDIRPWKKVKLSKLGIFKGMNIQVQSERKVYNGDRLVMINGLMETKKGPYNINTMVIIPANSEKEIYSLMGIKESNSR